ncbi:MAG TPA: PVC-type heme-binding CxxCH protein, partial [Thermoanaerobaculia bacterium]|nr:PVC-type heme-binding CxxCH protein [Thermoanaerobaculia bacterium]
GCAREATLPQPGSYELHPALEIELWAAEPAVLDPVALTFDAAERMYVVEMRDYPEGLPPDGRPGGAVRLLEDTDGDGRADRSTVFAEGLSFPTSIAAWKGGVFVTAPPQILFLEDTDGDGRADRRQVVYDGFTLGVTDSNVNGLRWAIDNHFHGVNGGNGGHVRHSEAAGEAAAGGPWTSIRGLDFRFDPRTGAVGTTYHTSAGFGLAFDEWGRSFSPFNVDHLQQRVIPERYLARSPALPPVRATASISVHGAMARIFPISAPVTRPNHPEQAGHYSSAGGMGYLDFPGDGLPRGVLVCDVVGNLVSRETLRMEGPLYVAERAPEERESELFRSRDPAFRPVGVEMGPDGALYLIDMQRDVIEHPDYIPESLRRTLDLRAGSERGRIYRIAPRRGLPPAGPPLAGAGSERLVEELASPLRWRRDTAQRLLLERGAAPLDPLREMATARPAGEPGTERAALGRLHALWTLQGLHAIDQATVMAALDDPHPGVRENALQIAETLLPGAAALRGRIVAMGDDPSARVRFQAALTLGELASAERTAALLEILRRDAAHRFTRIAVASALGDGAGEALAEVLAQAATMPLSPAGAGPAAERAAPPRRARVAPGRAEPGALGHAETLVLELAELAGGGLGRDGATRLEALLAAALAPATPRPLAEAVLAGLAAGMGRAPRAPAATATIAAFLDRAMLDGSTAMARSAWRVRRAIDLPDGTVQAAALARAAASARDRALAVEERGAAVEVLALGRWEESAPPLLDLLAGAEPSELQARAVAALAGLDHPSLGRDLIDRFRGLGPPARREALRLLLRRPAFHGEVVSALEEGRLAPGELALDLEQRRRLLRSEAPGVARRAAALIDDHEYGNRAVVVEEWLARLPAAGSSARGRAIHQRLCAQCHVAAGIGHAVGPDLGSLAHRSAEDLVSNILDPNLAIHPSYVAFEVALASGDRELGLIAAESPTALTLVQAGGVRRELARREIASMRSTGASLMPTGIEQGLTPQDLRDLIELIQNR